MPDELFAATFQVLEDSTELLRLVATFPGGNDGRVLG
jgi:hypothetical protein